MKAFETRWFKKWAEKNRVTNIQLLDAIERTKVGLGVVDLGGNLFKIRIEKVGQGRSGGYRTILGFKAGKRSIFIYGFEKNDRDNIGKKELELYKEYAKTFLSHDEKDISELLISGVIFRLEDK